MLSADAALQSLESRLAVAVAAFAGGLLGDEPGALPAVASDIRQAARGHRIGRPGVETAECVARRFLAGEPMDGADLDRLAWALCAPVGPAQRVIASPRLDELLAHYRRGLERGELWRVTWLGLLSSAMAFDPAAADDRAVAGWHALRSALRETWPLLLGTTGRQAGAAAEVEPDWMSVLRDHPALLSADPCSAFVDDCLAGGGAALLRVERELGIPSHSWFWRAVLLAATQRACGLDDTSFRAAARSLAGWMRDRPAGRDEALARLFERCALCADRRPIADLRDFAFDRHVWRSPRLRDCGTAPAWQQVSDDAWRTAMGWLSGTHFDVFFGELAARHDGDEGRHEFWSRYAGQIAWSRLAVGAGTLRLARTRPAIARLLRDGDVAVIENRWPDVDALVFEIGGYVFVEFGARGSTCYAYPRNHLPFDRDARRLSGGSADLRAGYYYRGEPRDLRIAAGADRAARMAQALWRLGVEPDHARERDPAVAGVPLHA